VLSTTGIPAMPIAMKPGVPCALTGATAASPGRCAGGDDTDDLYKPFTIGRDEPVDIVFSAPIRRSSITRGTQCGQGSVRIEEVDAGGACTGAVAGTLIIRERELVFVPDVPWAEGKRYRVTLNAGGNDSCDTGELCDLGGAVNFDPLNGMGSGDGGGANLVIPFTVAPPTDGTYLMNYAAPFTDINGSGTNDPSELKRLENHATMKIIGFDGFSSAVFKTSECDMSTDNKTACMYMIGAMPVVMGAGTTTCPLPGGATAATCAPVTMSAQAMFGTNVTMTAGTIIGPIDTPTNIQSMRIRQGAGGQVTGYIVEDGPGKAKLVLALDLYMDAPDMSVPLSSHDLHSKQLTLNLEGPVTFTKDGRILIALSNTADLPITVAVSGAQSGHVMMSILKGEMKLQLVSTAPRGVSLQ
jgi:hypothetical protein